MQKNSCRIVLVDVVSSIKRNEKRLEEKIYKKTHEKKLLHDRWNRMLAPIVQNNFDACKRGGWAMFYMLQ